MKNRNSPTRALALCLRAAVLTLLVAAPHARAQQPAQAHAGHAAAAAQAPAQSEARAAFERFKRMEGAWRGRSTRGWEEAVSYKLIAAGTVLVGSSFDAHPNETMLTMFHMDGDRLMLTHYCVAKNQPRLVATSFADGGRTVTFTFLDATNLPSRDRGHMDKAVFRFADDGRVSSQWTWYQDGKEKWMEEIRLERRN